MAAVILGGLVTSTLLNLLILPTLALRRGLFGILVGLTFGLGLTQPVLAISHFGKIDGARSTITVHEYKSGFLSAFGHDHEIQAPIESGEVKGVDRPSLELRVAARKLRVLGPEASEKTRAQIQETMEGDKVLDVTRFPEIRFQSTALEAKGSDHWIVRGTLALHGKERPIAVDMALKGEHYRGSATLKQTDFGSCTSRGCWWDRKSERRSENRIRDCSYQVSGWKP